jgi:hypothetical protein
MKTVFTFITYVMFIFTFSCGQVQNNSSNNEAEKMIREFYTAYNIAWSRVPTPEILVRNLDSLQRIYCSENLRKKLKKQFDAEGLDHDLLTNDQAADVNYLEKLTIKKDSANANTYIISYVEDYTSPSNKKEFKMAIIHLSVVKEKETYKIDNVW